MHWVTLVCAGGACWGGLRATGVGHEKTPGGLWCYKALVLLPDDLEFRVWGSGFGVRSSGFGVWGWYRTSLK